MSEKKTVYIYAITVSVHYSLTKFYHSQHFVLSVARRQLNLSVNGQNVTHFLTIYTWYSVLILAWECAVWWENLGGIKLKQIGPDNN